MVEIPKFTVISCKIFSDTREAQTSGHAVQQQLETGNTILLL